MLFEVVQVYAAPYRKAVGRKQKAQEKAASRKILTWEKVDECFQV